MNRYIFPIIAVAVLVFALVSLNHGMSTNAQPDQDDDDQQQSQQDNKAQNAAKNTPPAPQAQAPGQDSPAPPDEVSVNDPSKAKYRIVAGWDYDSKNQSHQGQVNSTISALQNVAKNSHGQVSLQVVDVDVPDDARSAQTRGINGVGVTVNGKPVSSDNLGEGNSNPQAILKSMAGAAR